MKKNFRERFAYGYDDKFIYIEFLLSSPKFRVILICVLELWIYTTKL